jgi:hypothetical protein
VISVHILYPVLLANQTDTHASEITQFIFDSLSAGVAVGAIAPWRRRLQIEFDAIKSEAAAAFIPLNSGRLTLKHYLLR